MSDGKRQAIWIPVIVGIYFAVFALLQYVIAHWNAAFPPPSLIGR